MPPIRPPHMANFPDRDLQRWKLRSKSSPNSSQPKKKPMDLTLTFTPEQLRAIGAARAEHNAATDTPIVSDQEYVTWVILAAADSWGQLYPA